MNEPKRRGRPPKACTECGQASGHYDDCSRGMGVVTHSNIDAALRQAGVSAAQNYADRVWEGQSESADRAWRVQRVKEALKAQGLSFEGVVLS